MRNWEEAESASPSGHFYMITRSVIRKFAKADEMLRERLWQLSDGILFAPPDFGDKIKESVRDNILEATRHDLPQLKAISSALLHPKVFSPEFPVYFY